MEPYYWHGVWIEEDPNLPDTAYEVPGYDGVAWRVRGYQVVPDEETEWTGWPGFYIRTGLLVATMVGDDRPFTFPPSDLIPIPENSYCPECGQIGCTKGRLRRPLPPSCAWEEPQ